jgi:hypothetical protein
VNAEVDREAWDLTHRMLVEASMVPGACVRSGRTWAVLVHVHVHGSRMCPPRAYGPLPVPARASVVLLQEPGARPRLATIMTASLLSGGWQHVSCPR